MPVEAPKPVTKRQRVAGLSVIQEESKFEDESIVKESLVQNRKAKLPSDNERGLSELLSDESQVQASF